MTDVLMPQLGETVTEGTVTRWLKSVGESVERDEPLFEVSTDKVDSEVPAPAAGTLTQILVPEGETVDVGVRLAVIGEAGADASSAAGSSAATSGQSPAPSVAATSAPLAPTVAVTGAAPATGAARPQCSELAESRLPRPRRRPRPRLRYRACQAPRGCLLRHSRLRCHLSRRLRRVKERHCRTCQPWEARRCQTWKAPRSARREGACFFPLSCAGWSPITILIRHSYRGLAQEGA